MRRLQDQRLDGGKRKKAWWQKQPKKEEADLIATVGVRVSVCVACVYEQELV